MWTVKPGRLLNPRLVAVIGVVFCASEPVFLQAHSKFFLQESKSLGFEVASIKRIVRADESTNGRGTTGVGTRTEDPAQVSYLNITLKSLITRAYGVRPFQVRGPAWIDSERYDVRATIPQGASKQDVPVMLRNLITERFQISSHTEMKKEPGYALLVGRSGSKLRSADKKYYSSGSATNAGVPDLPPSVRLSTNGVTIPAATMEQFAEFLSRFLERPVVDSTGLEGTFQIALRNVAFGGSQGEQDMQASIFTAVRELGLNLKPQKVPLKYIVIDKAQKIPTEN